MAYAKKRRSKRMSGRRKYIAPGVIAAGIGGLANLATTIIGGGSAMKRAEKDRLATERQARQSLFNEQLVDDTAMLEDFDTQGIEGVEYYAGGGKMDTKKMIQMYLNGGRYGMSNGGYTTKGGALVPIDEGVELAVGNKHAENDIDSTYGIKLYNQGEPEAEIEDGEVIADGNTVFSDQLMYDNKSSFADKMLEIVGKRGKIEDKLDNVVNKRTRNSMEKKLANLNMAESALFQDQEAAKIEQGQQTLNNLGSGGSAYPYGGVMKYDVGGNMRFPVKGRDMLYGKSIDQGSYTRPKIAHKRSEYRPKQGKDGLYGKQIPKLQEGGFFDTDVGQGIAQAAPALLDNIVNMALTSKTPKLSTPLLERRMNLDTDINVNPQLAAVRRATRATTSNILGNTSSSSVARNAIAAAQLRGAEAEGQIMSTKENIETGLRNQNIASRQRTEAANRRILNQHLRDEFTRQGDIQSRISANVANLGEDISNIAFNTGQQNVEDEKLLNDLLDDPTGSKLRAMEQNPYVKQRMRRSKQLREAINDLRRTRARGRFNPIPQGTSTGASLFYGTRGLS